MTVDWLELYGRPEESALLDMHLQWFAAEDEGRTEDPTERKMKKAWEEEGKVAKSSELVQALVLLFSFGGFALLGRYFVAQVMEMMRFYFTQSSTINVTTTGVAGSAFFSYYFKLVGPIYLIAVAAAFLGNVVQVGFRFTTKVLKPNFSRIAPNFKNWINKTVFSSEGAFNFFKTIFKVIVIGVIAYVNIRNQIPRLANTINMSLTDGVSIALGAGFRILMEATLFFLALAIPDMIYQQWQHKESLKMSKHEIKEEYKEMEGDPQVKAKLRQRMQEIRRAGMMQKVPDANVVITNPTHFAVALEYKQESMIAPLVVAKGQDNMAQRIKEIAKENHVPIVENKPLARALFASVEIGDPVPEEYWRLVADILSTLMEVDRRAQ
ncbi:MAG: flagellar biosynthesis protein FlhB [Spirochaetales bacterium]|nr:flagellar biosynthesis protein FlhB [Spirochaetales bacterium]